MPTPAPAIDVPDPLPPTVYRFIHVADNFHVEVRLLGNGALIYNQRYCAVRNGRTWMWDGRRGDITLAFHWHNNEDRLKTCVYGRLNYSRFVGMWQCPRVDTYVAQYLTLLPLVEPPDTEPLPYWLA